MKVFYAFVAFGLIVACSAAPSAEDAKDEERIELFSGVEIRKDPTGSDSLNVKFQPGELKEAARTFEEARGKIKKYAPILSGLGVKAIAFIGILFGGLALLVTKAYVVAKLALMAAAAIGLQKLIAGGGLASFGKVSEAAWQASAPQWSPPTSASASYPYARSSNIPDGNDLAYKSQIPT